jgi:hypothetical protein
MRVRTGLQVDDIEPAAEFHSDLGHASDLAEVSPPVQRDAGLLLGADAGDDVAETAGAEGSCNVYEVALGSDPVAHHAAVAPSGPHHNSR